ncbi:hypothetical protein GVN21_20280, partial [Caulobacter sp. SLTY]|nr:hypothetical protein [Caulobacter sp. SLTY]
MTVSGTEGADSLNVAGNAGTVELVFGLGGDDRISARNDDRVDGGAGWDSLRIFRQDLNNQAEDLDVEMAALGYAQFMSGGGSFVRIEQLEYVGTQHGDRVQGHTGFDRLVGAEGSDQLYGRGGDDELLGGSGADELFGGDGGDLLEGGEDNDVVRGGESHDVLRGQGGDDNLEGGAGIDRLEGGDGADILRGGAGNDDMDGGAGADIFVFSPENGFGSGSDGIFNFEVGIDRISLIDGALVAGVLREGDTTAVIAFKDGSRVLLWGVSANLITEAHFIGEFDGLPAVGTLVGTDDGADLLIGGTDNDTLYGFAGDDQLRGMAGNDTLIGNVGDDWMVGGAGNDSFQGGEGFDAADFSGAGHLYIDLAITGPQNTMDGNDSFSSVEHLIGSIYENTFLGSSADEMFQGDRGADTLDGRSGDDILQGGHDGDTIRGGSGADTLMGDDGGDSLTGGVGADGLFGGAGADTFHHAAGDGADIIYDFDASDRINLTGHTSYSLESGPSGATIVLGNGDSITLYGLMVNQFSASQIVGANPGPPPPPPPPPP